MHAVNFGADIIPMPGLLPKLCFSVLPLDVRSTPKPVPRRKQTHQVRQAAGRHLRADIHRLGRLWLRNVQLVPRRPEPELREARARHALRRGREQVYAEGLARVHG